MTTTAQHLASLSGLPPGQAAKAHLVQIAGVVGVAGALLVLKSVLSTGSALQHLLGIHLNDYASAPGGSGYGRTETMVERPGMDAMARAGMVQTDRPDSLTTARPLGSETTRPQGSNSYRPSAASSARATQTNTRR